MSGRRRQVPTVPPPRSRASAPAPESRRPRRGLLALALAAPALLAACAQTGDFGRAPPTAWNDLVDATGSLAAGWRGEPASRFPLTDDEGELRTRAWRYLMPASERTGLERVGLERAAFDRALANLTRARVLPPAWRPTDEAGYHDALVAGPFRSPASRYRKLAEDILADGRLVPAFAGTAVRVIAADGVRLRSLAFVDVVRDAEVREAAMRVAENRCLIAWVRHDLALRAGAYRYALQHLLIEAPQLDAVMPERALGFLEGRRAVLDDVLAPEAEARCGLDPTPPAMVALAPPPGPSLGPPLVTK